MGGPENKKRVTLTINEVIYQRAQHTVKTRGTTISGVVERFLDFYSNPEVFCFKCGEKFSSNEAELCPKCGWMICPSCNQCRCSLDDDIATAVFYMREVYENLLTGSVKQA